jgi:hypothetical protein
MKAMTSISAQQKADGRTGDGDQFASNGNRYPGANAKPPDD